MQRSGRVGTVPDGMSPTMIRYVPIAPEGIGQVGELARDAVWKAAHPAEERLQDTPDLSGSAEYHRAWHILPEYHRPGIEPLPCRIDVDIRHKAVVDGRRRTVERQAGGAGVGVGMSREKIAPPHEWNGVRRAMRTQGKNKGGAPCAGEGDRCIAVLRGVRFRRVRRGMRR